jgi:DNA-binding winged helix-turn-helix (wHTH) protein
MNKRNRLIYEFGPYRLELFERRLLRNGEAIVLRPKLFDLLVFFVRHAGQVLEKDELLAKVWPDAEVEESNLTVSVNALRRTLGDERYIETVARHGYRFVMETHVRAEELSSPSAAAVIEAEAGPQPPGGALPLNSNFYITRAADDEFHTAIARRYSLVLVKGARQAGKTSLLARGLQRAREAGAAVVLTDFQHFTADVFASAEKLLLTLAELVADKLELDKAPHEMWSEFISPSSNFERYLRREVFTQSAAPLVWGLDEVDRLFSYPYASEIFGLFRSWHNLRALDPAGPWPRLTLAMAYATEAHLFIADLNQSPFNVGTRLRLEDFTPEQVADLNHRYGSPLTEEELERYFDLVGGHPYLAQRGFYEMTQRPLSLAEIEAQTDQGEGIFGDHLRRMLLSLERDAALREAVQRVLMDDPGLTTAEFYRLRSAGIFAGDSVADARPRCRLYDEFLRKHLF